MPLPNLKIAHVILSRGFAGSERSTAESANYQCLQNKVCVIVRKNHRRYGKSIIDHLDKRVRIIEVPGRFITKYAIKKAFADFQPDVIHCHLRRSTRITAQIAPDCVTTSTLHIYANGPAFMKMDGLICNASWQAEELTGKYQGAIFKANNSLIPHRRLQESEITQIRSELGIKPHNILVGAVGRYHRSKGWDTLIKAFMGLQEFEKARLVFFGTGSMEKELKQLAAKDSRIIFAGFKDNIKDLYQSFDLLVCPSRFEPLPRVILEAMDAGTPVIASDAGGCKELIDNYGGYCFSTDDIKDLQASLRGYLATPPKRHRPDLNAHHIENTGQATLNFYSELITQKQAIPNHCN